MDNDVQYTRTVQYCIRTVVCTWCLSGTSLTTKKNHFRFRRHYTLPIYNNSKEQSTTTTTISDLDIMGGDDLGSDDEFLQVAPNLESDDQHDFDETRTPERKEGEEKGSPSSGKRKSTAINSGVVESTYKKSKFASKNGALWEQDAQQQATFLSSALAKHLSPTLLSPPDVSPGILVTSKKESLVQRVTDIVSLNKIKKWNHKLSPCVVSCHTWSTLFVTC